MLQKKYNIQHFNRISLSGRLTNWTELDILNVIGQNSEEVADSVKEDLINSGLAQNIQDEIKEPILEEVKDEIREPLKEEIKDEIRDDLSEELKDELKDKIVEEIEKEGVGSNWSEIGD